MLSSHTAVTFLPLVHVFAAHSPDRRPVLSDEANFLDPRVCTPRGAARAAVGQTRADDAMARAAFLRPGALGTTESTGEETNILLERDF